MGRPDPSDNEPQLQITPNDMIKVGRYFFESFCEQNNVPVERRTELAPMALLEYLRTATAAWTPESLAEECKVHVDAATYMTSLPHHPQGINQLYMLWPYLVLGDRENKFTLKSVNLLLVLQYDDGLVVPMNLLADRRVLPPGQKLQDADVVHLITTNTPNLSNTVLVKSLDGLHDHFATRLQGVGEAETYEYIRNAIDSERRWYETQIGVPDSKRDALFKQAVNVLAFMQQLFPGEIPEHVRKALAAGANHVQSKPDAPADTPAV